MAIVSWLVEVNLFAAQASDTCAFCRKRRNSIVYSGFRVNWSNNHPNLWRNSCCADRVQSPLSSRTGQARARAPRMVPTVTVTVTVTVTAENRKPVHYTGHWWPLLSGGPGHRKGLTTTYYTKNWYQKYRGTYNLPTTYYTKNWYQKYSQNESVLFTTKIW